PGTVWPSRAALLLERDARGANHRNGARAARSRPVEEGRRGDGDGRGLPFGELTEKKRAERYLPLGSRLQSPVLVLLCAEYSFYLSFDRLQVVLAGRGARLELPALDGFEVVVEDDDDVILSGDAHRRHLRRH